MSTGQCWSGYWEDNDFDGCNCYSCICSSISNTLWYMLYTMVASLTSQNQHRMWPYSRN